MRYTWFLLIFALVFGCDIPRERISIVTVEVPSIDTILVYDTIIVYKPKPMDDYEVYIDTLRQFIGLREITGNNDHPLIDKFFDKTCGLRRNPWCGAVLSYALLVNDHEIPELPCWSPSFFPEDRVVWKRGDSHSLMTGQIFGIYFNRLKRVAHVGAVIEDFGDGWVLTAEGNTNDQGSREGNGFFIRMRHKTQIYAASDWIQNN